MSTISVNEIDKLFERIWGKLPIEKKIDLHNYFCYVHDFDEDEIVVDDNNTNVIDSEGDNSPFMGYVHILSTILTIQVILTELQSLMSLLLSLKKTRRFFSAKKKIHKGIA